METSLVYLKSYTKRMGNGWPEDPFLRAGLILSVMVLLAGLTANLAGFDHLIDWNLTATADKENIIVEQFERGPFSFEIEGQQYTIKETFGISKIMQSKGLSLLATGIVWLGISGFLAFATFLRRYAFLFVAALFLLYVNQLYLDDLTLFGPNSWKWASALFMISLLAPAYYLHAFRENSSFMFRWLLLFMMSSAFLLIFQYQDPYFYLYFAGQSTIPFAIIVVLFIFLVAEEIVFLVVLLITRSAGGTSNEKHFFVFSLVYLAYLILYWTDRMGLVSGSWDYLDPFFLLIISSVIAYYTIRHKQPLLDASMRSSLDVRWLFSVLAIAAFGYFILADVMGNDSATDAIDYIILYAHIGFGVMFVLYIIVNLITPLIQGLMIYKIVYKEHNFPYITSRLAGFIFIVAFYFYAEQAPLRRTQSARLNYLGDYYSAVDPNLGRSYFQEAAVFGWDNHYASMKLAEYAQQDGDISEAIYRFGRAVSRNPSAYAYVAGANAMQDAEESTRATTFLRQGSQVFPSQGELLNNLALLLDASGANIEALSMLEGADGTESWNQAVIVNQLAMGSAQDVKPSSDWNLQAKTNWQSLANKGMVENSLPFDIEDIRSSGLPKITYLVNSGWGTERELPDTLINSIAQQLRNRELSRNLKHSYAYNLVKSGFVNQSIPIWEQLIQSVSSHERGFYYRQLGNIYMKLHAPLLAREAFEKAVEFGSKEAMISYAIASMEAKDWNAAISMWEQVVLNDSSYFDLIGLTKTLSQSMIVPSFAWIYYNLPEDINQYDVFSELPQNQIRMLWDKLFWSWSYGEKQNDFAILTDRIKQQLSEAQSARYEEYQKIIQDPAALTYKEASKNAFEVWKVMMALEDEALNIDQKYDLLLAAISVNKNQVDLIISYVQYAIRMGLYEYAESATLRLLSLVTPEGYQLLERQFFDLRQARGNKLGEWSN